MRTKNATFDVLLVGGASGVGKTSIAYQLSKLYNIGVVEVDDFQSIVEHFTKEEDYPIFHYWKNHFDEAVILPIDKKLEIMITYANTLSEIIAVVVNNHLEEKRPVIIEGDFISPLLCKELLKDRNLKGKVKSIFIIEDDENQINKNYMIREGEEQHDRAELSCKYNDWIKKEIDGYNIGCIPSRPWETSLERVIEYLNNN